MIYVLHDVDSDGLCGALAVYIRYLNSDKKITYIPSRYGNFPVDINSLTKSDEVYIIDMSYSKEILDEVYNRVSILKVIDHHETAYNELKDTPYAYYDLKKSSAVLAHEYFLPAFAMHDMFKLVQDRDLWLFHLPHSKAFEYGMKSCSDFNNLRFWYDVYKTRSLYEMIINKGNILRNYIDTTAESYNKKFIKTKFEDKIVAVYNTTELISEIGNFILENNKDVDFTISYFISNNNELIISMRSSDDRNIHVGNICKKYNGGGHKNASGIKFPIKEGLEFIKQFYNF